MSRSRNKINAKLAGPDSSKIVFLGGGLTKPKAATKIIFIGLPQWGSGGRNKGTNPVNGYALACGTLSRRDLAQWIKDHMRELRP